MDATQLLEFVIVAIIAIFALGTILSGLFQVRTAEAVVVQRMGKFQRVAAAGINFKLPWFDQIAARIDLRVQQLALDVETKTKDNVFVKIPVSVQYHVISDHVYEAFYKLANPRQQISSYVFNVILGHVPKMNLDDAFLQQSDIAIAIKQGLDDVMKTYGYAIDQALVTDIQPDDKVKAAMNEINAAQREQVAATARGEAEKILKVKQAEADSALLSPRPNRPRPHAIDSLVRETKLKIRQTDQMETEVGIAVIVAKVRPGVPGGMVNTTGSFRLNLWTSLANFFDDSF